MSKKSFLRLLTQHKVAVVFIILFMATVVYSYWQWQVIQQVRQARQEASGQLDETQAVLVQVETELSELKNSDPHKTNLELQDRIEKIETTYQDLLFVYEKIDDFENGNYPEEQVAQLRELFAELLEITSRRDYEAAAEAIAEVKEAITEYQAERAAEILAAAQAEAARIAAEQAAQQATQQTTGDTSDGAPAPAAPSAQTVNEPPGNGYRRQVVSSDAGQFTVSIVAGDLSSTRVIVDTASATDCANDCPVISLGDYVARNGAYAGINGSYFCPASYPSCAGKTNSFDLLVMNKDKYYFNSDNNVYSTNPGVIFSPGSIRFVGAVSQWGRDTGIDSMLSNFPLLISGGNVVFGGDDDPKKGSKGNRSFVANRGNTVYIGVVHSATVAESARVLRAMGMDNALNLDDGGSTALWFGGYKVGPGRALPNAILFTHR